MTNYRKSYQLDFTFHMPPPYFALEVFLDKVLEGEVQVYGVTTEQFLLSALENEADNLKLFKKEKAIFKKNYSSLQAAASMFV